MTTDITTELDKLVTSCPHCGKPVLTCVGMLVQGDEDDPRAALVEGVSMACDCAKAKCIAEAQKAQDAAKECAERVKADNVRVKRLFEASGMPERWLQERGLRCWVTDELGLRAAYDAAVAFGGRVVRREAAAGLYVVGDIGAGKTFLCSCLCVDLVRKGVRVLWRNMSEVLREIRGCFDRRDVSEQEVIRGFVKPWVLVLDDLGKERPTEWAVEQLFSIVNARYDEGKPTIVTTNYNSEELARRLTPRPDVNGYADDTTARAIVDRLAGGSEYVILEGRSRRR